MAGFILLTDEQAASVRGASSANPAASLNPVERQDGVYILGVEVLSDLAHEAHWAYLSALPQMDSDNPDFPAAKE